MAEEYIDDLDTHLVSHETITSWPKSTIPVVNTTTDMNIHDSIEIAIWVLLILFVLLLVVLCYRRQRDPWQ
jgi:hypothetical protein